MSNEPDVIVVEAQDELTAVEVSDLGGGTTAVDVVAAPDVEVVEITTGATGPPGPQGPQGPVGPQGPPGTSAGSYTHHQDIASDIWVIDHPLGYPPNITVVDSSGSQVEGDVDYLTASQIIVSFSAAFTGVAYLS